MAKPSEDGRGLVILMYHAVVDASSPQGGGRDAVYDVELSAFGRQMHHLRAGGYKVLSLGEFLDLRADSKPLPPKAVAITFDDGDRSNLDKALPVLEEHGFGAEFFLTVDHLGRPGYLSWEGAKQLIEAGMGIGSHLMHHVYLDDRDVEVARQEMADSRRVLAERLNTAVDFLAPPGGRITRELEASAEAIGYRGVCNSRIGINRIDCNPWRMRRISIVGATPFESFRALVDQRRSTLWWRQFNSRALSVAKRALGNRRYDKVRERMLSRRHAR